MGGWGSGRYGGRPTAEGCSAHVLTTAFLHRCKVRYGQFAISAPTEHERLALGFTLDTRDRHYSFIELEHEPFTDEESALRYRVELVTTQPPFGGIRWWFLCPRTGRRVSKLFLPRGGRQFLSRQAYRLGYACQRIDASDRIHMRARRLHRALGGEGNWMDGPPDKPKWMRWGTYERKVDRLEALHRRLDRHWLPRLTKFLQRYE